MTPVVCGIAGVVAADLTGVPDDAPDAMAGAIRFRGPDASGAWSDGRHALLLSARLAIVDLETGTQPLTDSTGRFTIVFSGEVHNFVELRRELEARGSVFRTRSDTEVLLEGYKHLGPAVCERVVGMFAFAVWDSEERALFLARDRFGEKPLFWHGARGALWFASSCDALRAAPTFRGELSDEAIAEFTAVGSTYGSRTFFRDAWALPPGCRALVRPGDESLRPERWWRLDAGPALEEPDADLVERYAAALTDAVRIRLRSDVPVGVTFSGGVDSGTVAAVASRRLGQPLPCFTLDFDPPGARSDETGRAEQVASAIGSPWYLDNWDYRDDFLDELFRAYAHFDQPSWQPELAQVARVCRLIRPVVKVALTGNAADELFLGYAGNERLRLLDAVAAATSFGGQTVVDPVRALRRRLRRNVAQGAAPQLVDALEPAFDAFAAEVAATNIRSPSQLKTFYALTWGSVETNQRMPDVAGLVGGVELRSPFLDHRLVELAMRLPLRVKIRSARSSRTNKWIAKRFYEDLIGPEMAWAPKLNMGSNVRFDREMVSNKGWDDALQLALANLTGIGLEPGPTAAAWARYRDEMQRGRPARSYNAAVRGLMLGLWFSRGGHP